MSSESRTIHTLYRKLLTFYPQEFRDRLEESMEQTFLDLWKEKRQTRKGFFGFVLWTFIETALGIFREHLLLISPGEIMKNILKALGSSMVVSFLLTLPFVIMEVVNRRNYDEEFPFPLFIGIWLIFFAISLILLPIVQGRRTGNRDTANPVPTQGNTLLANPKSTAMISVGMILSLLIVPLLNSLGVISAEQLLNDPNPEKVHVFGFYVTGRFIMLVLISLPILAGIIAGGPIVQTLRAGGSLFAYPVNLIIVVLVLSSLAFGLTNLIIDQWPCLMGVPVCD